MGFFKPNIEKLKKKGDIEGLIKATKYPKNPLIRCKAVEAIGNIEYPRAVDVLKMADALFKTLCDSDLSVQKSVMDALKNVITNLLDILDHPDPKIQKHALIILEMIFDPKSNKSLQLRQERFKTDIFAHCTHAWTDTWVPFDDDPKSGIHHLKCMVCGYTYSFREDNGEIIKYWKDWPYGREWR